MMALLPMVAQAKVVTGRVTDVNGEGIISATVVVKGTSIGTVTDLDGNYSLDVPEGAILVFSYLGMGRETRYYPLSAVLFRQPASRQSASSRQRRIHTSGTGYSEQSTCSRFA